ncbi:DUF445 domain-containing protein [Desulfomicrobium escambiense]|uniref:DUF445 domain-containing protein n=1 Tax=Desulfomicrobium escambiense TaxID=29503 RepID=UPI000420C07D|nr:DUF445 family protein [Desulfomicrobium escambiense]
MLFKLCLSTVICAFIGWITNFIAIKMLFHPRRPVQIGSLTVQGIFPKRQKALAMNLAAVIEGELLSHDDIRQAMQRPEFSARLKERILDGFSEFLSTRLGSLNPMIAMFLDGPMMEKVKGLLDKELDRIVPGLLETATGELENSLDFRRIIQDKIENLSMERLEALLMSIMAREFRFIEVVGAVLGAIIGLIQGLLFF